MSSFLKMTKCSKFNQGDPTTFGYNRILATKSNQNKSKIIKKHMQVEKTYKNDMVPGCWTHLN